MRVFFFFSSRRRHTRYWRDWSSDVCSSDLHHGAGFEDAAVPLAFQKDCPPVDRLRSEPALMVELPLSEHERLRHGLGRRVTRYSTTQVCSSTDRHLR